MYKRQVKYSGKNGKVRVELRHEDHDVVLTVADNGPGIPEEDLPKAVSYTHIDVYKRQTL